MNDGNGHTYSKNFTIGVNDINEKPTDIQFTGNSTLAVTDGSTLVGAQFSPIRTFEWRTPRRRDRHDGNVAERRPDHDVDERCWLDVGTGRQCPGFLGRNHEWWSTGRITPFVSTGAISVSMYARMDNVDGGTKEWQRLFDFGDTNNTINGGQVYNSDDMRLEVILNGVYYSVVGRMRSRTASGPIGPLPSAKPG